MVERRFAAICAAADLPAGEVATGFEEAAGPIAVFNIDGELLAIADCCSHQEARLSDGFVEGCAVECPLHGSMFDLKTGMPDGPPATAPVRVYPVSIEAGVIVVDVG